MPDQDLIDGLVATYRTLNMQVRQLPDAQLRADTAQGGSVRDTVLNMRNEELHFSQALKARITGVAMPDILGEELPAIGTETDDDSTAALIAQFGTARESTLAMLRSLPDADWDQSTDSDKSIRTRIFELVDRDRKQIDRIASMIGAPAT